MPTGMPPLLESLITFMTLLFISGCNIHHAWTTHTEFNKKLYFCRSHLKINYNVHQFILCSQKLQSFPGLFGRDPYFQLAGKGELSPPLLPSPPPPSFPWGKRTRFPGQKEGAKWRGSPGNEVILEERLSHDFPFVYKQKVLCSSCSC